MSPSLNNSPSIKITHVIFDLDGLLVDTEGRYDEAYTKVARRYGKEYTIELKQKATGRHFLDSAQIIVDELQLPLTAEEADREFQAAYGPRVSTLMPGAERLVRHLHCAGIPMAVATGSPRESFRWKAEPHQELFSLFSHVLLASEDEEVGGRGKPDPQPFLVCASRFTSPPLQDYSSVLVFEDAEAGVMAANAAGMRSIWVPDPRTSEKENERVRPYKRLNSLLDFEPTEFGIPPF